MDDEEMDDEEEYDFEYSDNLPSSDAEHDDEPSPVVRSRQSSLASSAPLLISSDDVIGLVTTHLIASNRRTSRFKTTSLARPTLAVKCE